MQPRTRRLQPVDHADSYYHYGLARSSTKSRRFRPGRQDCGDSGHRAIQDGAGCRSEFAGVCRMALPIFTSGWDGFARRFRAAQDQVAKHPEDVDAHLLLGHVYLRDPRATARGRRRQRVLQAAIKEYETIVQLKPGDLDNRLLLGQLYGLESQFCQGGRTVPCGSEDRSEQRRCGARYCAGVLGAG